MQFKTKKKYGNVVKMCKKNVNHKIFWIFINDLIETMGMSPYNIQYIEKHCSIFT